ncbi:MAG: Gx transporter family protein [Lachnospiraceae bacterium]|nr:Gx transporter family protein [Lachnospiraceae bacterium]
MKRSSAGKIAYLGLLTSLAVIMGYVEYLIPFRFPVPGVKLGLANVVIVPVLYWFGLPAALIVSVIRILISGILFGNAFGVLYSLFGTLLSLLTMELLRKTESFSVIGVSAAGGAMHNLGQIIAAMVITGTPAVIRYLPVLLVAGDITGCLIGFISAMLLKRVSPDSAGLRIKDQ